MLHLMSIGSLLDSSWGPDHNCGTDECSWHVIQQVHYFFVFINRFLFFTIQEVTTTTLINSTLFAYRVWRSVCVSTVHGMWVLASSLQLSRSIGHVRIIHVLIHRQLNYDVQEEEEEGQLDMGSKRSPIPISVLVGVHGICGISLRMDFTPVYLFICLPYNIPVQYLQIWTTKRKKSSGTGNNR